MAFEWMTDPAFRAEVERRVRSAAGTAGMGHYQTGIVDEIMSRLRANAKERRLQEERRPFAQRRSKDDALASVGLLVGAASRYAAQEKRSTVTVDDFQLAYRANYCKVWPVC